MPHHHPVHRVLTILFLILCSASLAQAATINPVGISETGTYHNDSNLMIDGYLPPEGTHWQSSFCVYWNGTTPAFVIDFGSPFDLQDIKFSVDNNDDYAIDYSLDGSNWSNLVIILSSYGNIAVSPGGMDTMSSISTGPEYIPQLDFAPRQAQYLKVYATGGDNMYSIAELQSYGDPVPIPGAVYLLGSGLVGLVGLRRQRNK
ncbi:MAG: hypothetical protein V1736_10205 [Pseudomonadota bacterium]